MTGIEFDTSEITALQADIEATPSKLRQQGTASLHRGSNNIARQLREEAQRSRWFRLERHISYDMTESGDTIESEIGAVKEGAGRLANIAIFGGRRGGGGNVPDPDLALMAEAPRFEDAMGDIGEDIL